MSASDLTVGDIKALLIERLDALVGELVPGAKSMGGYFTAKCPWRVDRRAGSFVVWKRGNAAGGFKDFAAEETGDAIDLIAFARCGAVGKPTREERVKAIQWAKSWLGISSQDRATLERVREKARRDAQSAEVAEIEKRRKKRRRALDLWMAGRDWRGTPVEAYLRGRGIDLDRIEHWDDGLRYAPRLDHWQERHVGPAMLAAFRHPTLGFSGLHATWLRPDGSGKADVDKPKLMLGGVHSAAIRLTRGADDWRLPCHEGFVASGMGAPAPLAIGEGIETMLSVAAGDPDLRVWAAGSLGNIGEQPNSPAISAFILCRDNDFNATALRAFEKAREKLGAHGKPIVEASSFHGKDMNDLAQYAPHAR